MTLFWQHFKAQLAGLLIWTGAAVGMMMVMANAAPSFIANGILEQYLATLPEVLVKMAGLEPGLAPLDGYVAAQVGKSVTLVTPLYAVMLALNVVTREVDRRTIDFLLAMPVRRAEVILARVAVMLTNTGILTAAMGLAMYLAFKSAGLEGNWAAYNLIFFNIWLLGAALGGITLLASLWVDDYGLGVKTALGLVSTAYFLEMVFRALDLSRTARLLSPFSYLDATRILKNGALPVADTLILALVALVTIGLSLPVFERKQISA